MEEPVTRVELVVGAPGMGKTRLALAALDAARARHPSLRVWWLRGDAAHATPFATIGPGLRAAAGIAPEAPVVRALRGDGGTPPSGRPALDAHRQKLAAHLAQHVGAAELPRVAAFLGEVAGIKNPLGESAELAAALVDPAQMGGRIVAAWQGYLAAYCAAHPLVVVLDDAQWADHASLSLLDAGLAAVPRLPLLVLALARPEVHTLHPALWKERAFEELRLGELSPRAAGQLLGDALGPQAPPGEVERLAALGRGNPRTLISLTTHEGDAPLPAGSESPTPALALAVATLERLPPLARRALRALAIVGAPAPAGAVRHLLGDRREDAGSAVEDALQAGVDASLLTARSEPGRPRLFSFRDALIERAAHAALTEPDARLGHRLVAGWLAGHGGDAARIAMHLERGGAAAQALHERVRAGHAALLADELADAARQVDASTRLLASPGLSLASVGDLRVLEAEVQRVSAAYVVARRAAEEAMAVLPRGAEPWLRAAREVAASCVHLGDDQRLQALAADLTSVPAAALASAPAVCAVLGICEELWHAALPSASQQCAAHFGLVMAAAARVDVEVGAAAEEVRAARALFGGEPQRALAHARAALAARRGGTAARATRRAALLEARALAALGDGGAAPALEAVIAAAASRADLEARSCAGAFLALWQLEHQGAAAAWPRLEEALDRAVEQGDRRTEARVRCGLARVLAPQGSRAGRWPTPSGPWPSSPRRRSRRLPWPRWRASTCTQVPRARPGQRASRRRAAGVGAGGAGRGGGHGATGLGRDPAHRRPAR
ncbi:MAG: AAA family ATPase [Polyangiaceae bacterium]